MTVEAAQAAVDVIAQRLQRQYPQEKGITARVFPEPMARPIPARFLSELVPLIRGSMLGLAGLVLLIACMNVANLLLVRATVRQREMAMRSALGSGRARLVRLLLVESLLLAFAGTAAGLLFARWATGLFAGSLNIAVNVPLNIDFDYDWRVFAVCQRDRGVAGGLMGLVPALRASRAEVTALLHDGGHGGSAGGGRQRLRSGMVVAQVAGSLVLLIVAGLCIRSSQRAQLMDLGFDAANVLTLRVDPHQVGYTGPQVGGVLRRARAQAPRAAGRRVGRHGVQRADGLHLRRLRRGAGRGSRGDRRPRAQRRVQPGHAGILRPDAHPDPATDAASR